MDESAQPPQPESEEVRALRHEISAEAWARRVATAQARAGVVAQVRSKNESGVPVTLALKQVAPGTSWPTFQYWNRRVGSDLEGAWERLVDRRVPPRRMRIPERVRESAILLRQANPEINYDRAREILVRRHGKGGEISNSSLFRIWHDAGLIREMPEVATQEEVEHFHGGAALALLGAAAVETGAAFAIAEAAMAEARHTVERVAELDLEIPPEPAGRDEQGRFTVEYNHSTRAGLAAGLPDARWAPDYKKRQERELASLQVMEHRPYTWAMKLLTIGAVPLITGLRGLDGLDTPLGEFIGVLGGCAYKSATLDKFLTQLALLDVEDALWYAHAQIARQLATRWASAGGLLGWLALVVYIDATQDSHWTDKYAMSGKVSRTGRVGPCLSRITVTAGPGVPLLMETFAGTVSLKKELPRVLERVDSATGEGELGRLTVIDAEMATAKLMQALISTKRSFITVLKGRNLARDFKPSSDWQTYRGRDELREGTATIRGAGAPKAGLEIRCVEMRREGRHTQSTFFGTNASTNIGDDDHMATSQVADAYLSRWPHQEHLFRNSRNGLGLDKTHGYGGEMVQHVAVDTKIEKAERQLDRAKERQQLASLTLQTAEHTEGKAQKTEKKRGALVTKMAWRENRAAKAQFEIARQKLEELKSTPREIYQRDTARENIVTALTMNVFLQIEYVLREYFGGARMELRTFIDQFLYLPITIVTSSSEVHHRIHLSARNPKRAEQMRKACEEVTRRRIRRDGKLLVFEAVPP